MIVYTTRSFWDKADGVVDCGNLELGELVIGVSCLHQDGFVSFEEPINRNNGYFSSWTTVRVLGTTT